MGIGSVGGSDFDPLSVIQQMQDQKIGNLQSQLSQLPNDDENSNSFGSSQVLGGLQSDTFSGSSSIGGGINQANNDSTTQATRAGLAAEDNSGSSDSGGSVDVVA